MRSLLLVILISTAWADKKVVDMTPGYKRELGSCETEQGGVQRMIDKTKRYLSSDPADKADIEKDVERLAKGLEVVSTYCKQLGGMVEFLEANKATPYKKIEKELDDHYRAVVSSRKEAKKELEDTAPITRKLIPIVNSMPRPDEKKKATAKFPSGRVAELPGIGGSWKLGGNATTDTAELADKTATVAITSTSFAKMSCEQQRKQLVDKAGAAQVTELDLSAAAKAIDVAWSVRYVRKDKTPHMLTAMCIEAGMGGFVVIADVTPADQRARADSVIPMMVSMLAARSEHDR